MFWLNVRKLYISKRHEIPVEELGIPRNKDPNPSA
jgi:hypothetical protein